MTLGAKLREAAQRAQVLSVNDDDQLITIQLRPYGCLVEGRREIDDKMLRHSRQVLWSDLEQSRSNLLLVAVDYVGAELRAKEPAG